MRLKNKDEILKTRRAIAIAVANVDVWIKDGVLIFPDFTSNRQKYFIPVYNKADKRQSLPKPIGFQLSKVRIRILIILLLKMLIFLKPHTTMALKM